MVETCQEVEALHCAALGEGLVVKANPQVPLLGLLLPKYATSGRGGPWRFLVVCCKSSIWP